MDKETFLKYGCNFFNCGSQRCDGSNEWLEGCRHWKKLNEPNLEIERKWLVSGFPEEIQPKKASMIEQSYLIAGDSEVRIRHAEPIEGYPPFMSSYKMTLKGPGTLARKEIETELTDVQFLKLMKFLDKDQPPIIKEFYIYNMGGKRIEISRVDGSWYYAEVEFKSDENFFIYQFPWPELVIKEVTNVEKYKMKNYWRQTREGVVFV